MNQLNITEITAIGLLTQLKDQNDELINKLQNCVTIISSEEQQHLLVELAAKKNLSRDATSTKSFENLAGGYSIAINTIVNLVNVNLDLSKMLTMNKCSNITSNEASFSAPKVGISQCDGDHQKTCDIAYSAFDAACSASIPVPGVAPLCAISLIAIFSSDCLPCIDEFNIVPVCTAVKALTAIDCNLYLGHGDGTDMIGKRCGLPTYSADKVEASSCSCNGECQSNACGRAQAGAENLQCCKSGVATELYAGFYYCYGMSAGTPCWSDAMCSSGYCKGNAGGLQKGVCTDKLPNGVWGEPSLSECDSDADCSNDSCARLKAGTDTLNCCPDTDQGIWAGFFFCHQAPTGTPCWSDSQCRNGNCKGNMYGVQQGICN